MTSTTLAHPTPRPRLDPTTPTVSRVMAALRDGKDAFPADRCAAAQLPAEMAAVPPVLRRAARDAVTAMAVTYGIRQILCLGSDLPHDEDPHVILARAYAGTGIAPRTAYVDHDAVVIAHSRAYRGDFSDPWGVASVDADVRNVGPVLQQAARMIDLAQPVGMLLPCAMFIPDQDAGALLYDYSARLAPGSVVWLTYAGPMLTAAAAAWNACVPTHMVTRHSATVQGWLKMAGLTDIAIRPLKPLSEIDQRPTGLRSALAVKRCSDAR